jgi:hypothetical protein
MRHIQLGDRAFKVLFIFTVAFLTMGPFVVAWEYKQVQKQVIYANGTVIQQTNDGFGVTTTTVQLDNGTIITFKGCNSELRVGQYIYIPFLDGTNLLNECD